MKSIKPGRGPSFMSGVSCIFVALFGVVWTGIAVSIGAGFFSLFGVVFILFAIVQAIYNFHNATQKNRYSSFDIVDGNEETDPLNHRFGAQNSLSSPSEETYQTEEKQDTKNSKFCPYCGTKLEENFKYCNQCGKKIP
ncbi:MAG: zinc ribbon domain-containing protein [Clostridia bacterium]|nr:zinc ribbon domain-containing protein [Clostridia bacterium]